MFILFILLMSALLQHLYSFKTAKIFKSTLHRFKSGAAKNEYLRYPFYHFTTKVTGEQYASQTDTPLCFSDLLWKL